MHEPEVGDDDEDPEAAMAECARLGHAWTEDGCRRCGFQRSGFRDEPTPAEWYIR